MKWYRIIHFWVTMQAGIIEEILDTGESGAYMLLNTIFFPLLLEAFSTTDQLLKAK